MRLAQINCVCGNGSTGRTSTELATYLFEQGHDSRVFYSEGRSEQPFAVRYMADWERKVHAVLSRLTGLQGYFSRIPTRRLIRMLEGYQPDVVHLRVLHGNNICLPLLFGWLAKKRIPVVVTLHDFWMLTGKCTSPVLFACDRFAGRCGRCPAQRAECPSFVFDFSRRMQRDRARWYAALADYRIVGVSRWCESVARRASTIDPARTMHIYNWIDAAVFYPRDTSARRRALGLEDRFVILGVSTRWYGIVRASKGLPDLLKIAADMPADCVIVLAGQVAADEALPENVVCVGSINDVDTLAEYYSLADVFVNPSRAETFGKTTAEALCCGTPAVAYELTATPELIGPGCGYVVPFADGAEGLTRRVLEIRARGKAAYTEASAAYAHGAFDRQANMSAYLSVYQSLLQTKGND